MFIWLADSKEKEGGFTIRDTVHISRRELMVLVLMANGIDNENIAKRFGIKIQSVRNHLQNITKKLGAKNKAHAVALCIRYGMLRIIERPEDAKESDFVWCYHCQRTYMTGEFRYVEGEKFEVNHVKYDLSYEGCPYEDCDGSVWGDAFDWDEFREHYPDYPEIPERGIVYEYV